jgi:hypothetical protein
MEEKEIIDIIKKYVGYTDRSMTDQCLHEVNFNLVAKEIVEKLTKEEVDIIYVLPTKEEIENKANSYNNSMSSIAESTWMPKGFKEGVEWIIKKLKK